MRRRKDNSGKRVEQRQARRDAFLKLGMLFLGVLLVADTVQIARFGEIVERVDLYNKGVVDELGGFREDIVAFGNDINEMRSFLLMPTKKYSFMDENQEVQEEDQAESSQTEQALYKYMTAFIEDEQVEKNAEAAQSRIKAFGADQDLKEKLLEKELQMGSVEEDEFSILFKLSTDEDTLFAVVADKKTGEMKIQSAAGSYLIEGDKDTAVKSEIIAYVAKNKSIVEKTKKTIEDLKTYIENLTDDENISKILSEKNVTLNTAPEEDEENINYKIINSEGEDLMKIKISRGEGKLYLNDNEFDNKDNFKTELEKSLSGLDTSTALEKLVSERRSEFESAVNQEAFQDLLKSNNLELSLQPREEYNKLLYDVKDADGAVKFSFVIELSSGYFKILQDDQEIDLYSVLIDGSKKNF